MSLAIRRSAARAVATAAMAGALLLSAPGVANAAGPDLLTWGQNNQGQLCDGSFTNRTTPVFPSITAGTTVVAIGAGKEDTSYFVLNTGAAYACGNNQFGQLGTGTTTLSNTPVQSVFPVGTIITDVDAGRNHAVWLTSTGLVYAAGINNAAQLGDGTLVNHSTPVLVDLPPNTVVTAIAAGWDHTLAITSTGGLLAWGYNANGQLGDNTVTNRSTPVPITLPSGNPVIAIAANGNHTIAIDSNQDAFVWGEGADGANCNASVTDLRLPIAAPLPVGTVVNAIGAGLRSSLFVTSTGGVLDCGQNNNGELGDGTLTNRTTPVAMILPVGTVAVAAAGGYDHRLVLTNAGRILATGYNGQGQLGDGTNTQRTTPVPSLIGAGTTLNLVAAGANQSMAVGTFSLTGVPLANRLVVGGALTVGLGSFGAWSLARRRRSAAGLSAA